MNIWEMLGITPTNDQSIIKNAFAEKSKSCHPEDDADAFMKLRQAYKAAMALAVRNAIRECDDNEAHDDDDSMNAPQTDNNTDSETQENEDSMHSNELDQDEKEEKTQDTSDSNVDFDAVLEPESVVAAKEKKQADALIRKAARIYGNKFLRNKHYIWRKFFASREFNGLKNNGYFTNRFLSFIMQNHLFEAKLWDGMIRPAMKAWQYEWYATKLWEDFDTVDKLYPLDKDGSELVYTRIIIAIGVLFVIFFLVILSYSPKTSTETETVSDIKIRDIIPITDEEFEQMYLEREERAALQDAIMEETPYSEVSDIAQRFELSQETYDSLTALYLQNTEQREIKAALSEYGEVEAAIIAEKLMPTVRSDIISGNISLYGEIYGSCLGIYTADYNYLIVVYEKAGEEALDAVLTIYRTFSDYLLNTSVNYYIKE